MNATEHLFDESLYDAPVAIVPADIFPYVATRGSAEMQAAQPIVQAMLQPQGRLAMRAQGDAQSARGLDPGDDRLLHRRSYE